MGRRPRVRIPELRHKLDALRSALGLRFDDELAKKIGVSGGTLSDWIKGRDDKGTHSNEVSADAFDRLCALLIESVLRQPSRDEAEALWRGTREAFELAASRRTGADLLSVLKRTQPNLLVRAEPHDPASLGMESDWIEGSENAQPLASKMDIQFQIKCNGRRGLIVLWEYRNGWRILAPSTRHDGTCSSPLERFPKDLPLMRFRDTPGLNRIVFISHSFRARASLPRSGDNARLALSDFNNFASELTLPPWEGKWEWAQMEFDVV